MFILIIGRSQPTLKHPLNGIFEFDQAKALHNLGHKVVFASINLCSIRRWRKWGTSYFVKNGIEVYDVSIPLGRVPWRISYYFGEIGLLYIYRKIKKKYGKPDIIHAHFTMIGAIASILKKKYNLPLVFTEHSSSINRNAISRKTFSFGKIAFKNADKIISVSLALSKRIRQHFYVDSIIVHNLADSSIFNFNEKVQDDKFTFISVGSLIYEKGHDLLIEAFHHANLNNNVYLYIIGGGHLQAKLQKKINTFGLNEKIILTGQIERNEIGRIMQRSDAFVLASRVETFGVVYIEAMLAGLPVIATACGGPEEFVDKDNGILIPVDNVELLAKALIDMHNNINKFKREQISQQCRHNFSPEVIGKRLSQIYSEVLNG
jgi:glycosyltransferase involved in cell wall biosynthesis